MIGNSWLMASRKQLFMSSLNLILEDSFETFDRTEEEVRRKIRDSEGIVLCGAGALGLATFERCKAAGLKVLAFTDNDVSKNGELRNLPVVLPSIAAKRWPRGAFVVTVFTSGDLWNQLEYLRLKPISFASLAWAYADSFLPYYSIDHPSVVYSHAKEIENVFVMWSDRDTRMEYLNQLSWRTTLSPRLLDDYTSRNEILFDGDIVKLTADETYVDCGAFDGDTIRQFLCATENKCKEIYAFEPDTITFKELAKYSRSLSQKITTINEAVGSKSAVTNFNMTGTPCSAVGGGGQLTTVCALDDCYISASFVKIDVEGEEMEVIRGAANLIKLYQPIMAVCLYHNARHLWEVPALLKSLVPDYSLYLRRYSNDTWEQVCYAVPKNRTIK